MDTATYRELLWRMRELKQRVTEAQTALTTSQYQPKDRSKLKATIRLNQAELTALKECVRRREHGQKPFGGVEYGMTHKQMYERLCKWAATVPIVVETVDSRSTTASNRHTYTNYDQLLAELHSAVLHFVPAEIKESAYGILKRRASSRVVCHRRAMVEHQYRALWQELED